MSDNETCYYVVKAMGIFRGHVCPPIAICSTLEQADALATALDARYYFPSIEAPRFEVEEYKTLEAAVEVFL